MSVTRLLRSMSVATAFFLVGAGASEARDAEIWSYAQPGNALVMPFDATDDFVSFLVASNVGPKDVTSHWVFWSEDCDHLVDVWLCLTPNDTTIVDPTDIRAIGPDNQRIGPTANLTGYRGMAVVTAYETNSSCAAASEGGSPADGALVGSYTLANRSTNAAFGNDAITLGLDPTGTYTDLPNEVLEPYFDIPTFDPTTVEESLVVLMALEERTGGGDGEAEVGPLRSVSADVTFYDNMEIPTSLPSTSISCTLFTSAATGESPSLVPAGTTVESAGFLRLSNVRVGGEELGGDTWLFGVHEEAIDIYGTSANARYVLSGLLAGDPTPTPTPAPTPTPSPEPTAEPTPAPTTEPTPDPGPTEDPGPTPEPTAAPAEPCTSVTARVTTSWNETDFPDVSGVTTVVGYPGDLVDVPGSLGNAVGAVTNLTGVVGGLFNVSDQDDPNQGPVAITVGLVAIPGPIPAGDFADVEMDCVSGQAAPEPEDFDCALDASTGLGAPVTGGGCSVSVTIVP